MLLVKFNKKKQGEKEEEVKSLFIHCLLSVFFGFLTHSGYFLLHTLLFDLIYVMAELRISITGNCNAMAPEEKVFGPKTCFDGLYGKITTCNNIRSKENNNNNIIISKFNVYLVSKWILLDNSIMNRRTHFDWIFVVFFRRFEFNFVTLCVHSTHLSIQS